jgi:hypothetical protein
MNQSKRELGNVRLNREGPAIRVFELRTEKGQWMRDLLAKHRMPPRLIDKIRGSESPYGMQTTGTHAVFATRKSVVTSGLRYINTSD